MTVVDAASRIMTAPWLRALALPPPSSPAAQPDPLVVLPSLSAILLQSAATFISLSPPESPPDMRLSAAGKASDAFTPVFEGVASVVFKKHSGKVVRETTGFRITRKSGETRIELVARPTAIPVPAVPEPDVKASQAPDPAANLSFNLSLTDEQRQQRAQVVLPYLQAQQIQTPNEVVVHPSTRAGAFGSSSAGVAATTTTTTSASASTTTTGGGGGGLIHYQPDDADDFDDEDPDDDLDI
nr:hypothetical protein HK105_007050 [Polyrhizophydium stewartii]